MMQKDQYPFDEEDTDLHEVNDRLLYLETYDSNARDKGGVPF